MKILGIILIVISLLHFIPVYTAESEPSAAGVNERTNLSDAVWLKETADKFAECVGIHKAGAWFMRSGGREEGANYLEDLATGAHLLSMLLLTFRADLEGKVLYGDDSSEYVEAIAYGEEGRLKMMLESTEGPDDPLVDEAFSACNNLLELQATILSSMRESKLDQ